MQKRKKFLPKPKLEKVTPVNELIRFPELLLIDETGANRGKLSTAKALALAREKNLDLIVVNPMASPPVAKILDFGKYRYEQEKSEKKAKAGVKSVELKGVRLTFRMSEHDLNLRREQTRKFLEEGHQVKVEMILRGRERAHAQHARKILNGFASSLGQTISVLEPISQQGGRLSLILIKK